MKVLDEGHRYLAVNVEDKAWGQAIHFIKKEPIEEGSTELHTIHDGTTNEELLRILIDRIKYLNGKFPCRENSIVITKLEESLMWLKKRTEDRINRNVEGKNLK